MGKIIWTEQMTADLLARYPTGNTRELAKDLGVTRDAVKSRTRLHRITKAPGYRGVTALKLSPDQQKLFKELYPETPNPQLEKLFDISESTVIQYARRLGVCKSKRFMSDPYLRGCFPKGHESWNKGTKGLTSANTHSFKKGSIPKNHLPVGSVTVRKRYNRENPDYLWIKIAELNKWEMLNVHIWKAAKGSVPKDHIIIFKDRNTMNCKLENLECISNAEHMRRNSGSVSLTDNYVAATISRDPVLRKQLKKMPQVLDLKRQSIILKRKIHDVEKET